MKIGEYTMALLGIVPGTVLYCFIGATAGSLTSAENPLTGPVATSLVVLGVVFGSLALFVISYYAKIEFDKIVTEQQEWQSGHEQDYEPPVEDDNKVEII